MRYQMKQKLLSWGDDFYARDEQGNGVYFFDGNAFSFGDQLSFRDRAGNELACIMNALLSLLHHRFTIDVPGPDDLGRR